MLRGRLCSLTESWYLEMAKLYIIGIGYKPSGKAVEGLILSANVILASDRLFDIFREYEEYSKVRDKVRVINNVDSTIEFIKSQISAPDAKIVLLASGDPLFFGIGRRAIREFGKDAVEVFPDLSSIQAAFSKIKEAWDDAFLMSLHGGPDPCKRRNMPYKITDIPILLKTHNKIAILTDKQNNPSRIAQALSESVELPRFCPSALRMFVCEKLGYPDEMITEGAPEELASRTFSHPNLVVILSRHDSNSDKKECLQTAAATSGSSSSSATKEDDILFGLSERDIIHSGGLITKDEVRAVTLHKLKLVNKGVFWDVGAGSGSISLEAARLCPEMKIFAIEKDSLQAKNILSNKIKFGAGGIKVIEGEAPSAFEGLPLPQRVFIGGSGGRLEEIIKFISEIGVEIVVINAATIETLNKAVACLGASGYDVDVVQLSISRMKRIGDGNFFSALNPVFIISGRSINR